MKIGMIGLGKLGLSCALAIESKGHEVVGYDIRASVQDILDTKILPYQEEGAQELLEKSNIKNVDDFTGCEIVFIAVQTPHEKEYEGISPLPETRKDFDYTYLINAVKYANDHVPETALLVIISTVLPGTIERKILPITKHEIVYNPFFIAMGTTIYDFLNPEFVLLGSKIGHWDRNNDKLCYFYLTIHKPIIEGENNQYWCSIREAEMIKVSYNTFITAKICIANTIMEMCHKLEISSDVVMNALKLGTDRIISTKYLNGGMGDGGACHPRDGIALSYLAQKHNLSFDFYESLMTCRDKQTKWVAELIAEKAQQTGLPIIILGKAFKKNVNITTGSPAMLLAHYLREANVEFKHIDPFVDKIVIVGFLIKAVYFIATNHDIFSTYEFPEGSEVIDIWREFPQATIKIG